RERGVVVAEDLDVERDTRLLQVRQNAFRVFAEFDDVVAALRADVLTAPTWRQPMLRERDRASPLVRPAVLRVCVDNRVERLQSARVGAFADAPSPRVSTAGDPARREERIA